MLFLFLDVLLFSSPPSEWGKVSISRSCLENQSVMCFTNLLGLSVVLFVFSKAHLYASLASLELM